MAYLLRILVAVTMISLCSAQCMMEQNGNLGYNNHKHAIYATQQDGCFKDGVFHDLGHEWISNDCLKCTCHMDHISCCSNYAKPILADTKNCEAVLNKDTCKMEVKPKDNSGRICKIESWVA